jgi:hypothetical protein
VTRSQYDRIGGLLIRTAEVDFGKRRHQRIVGADPESPETLGKTLVYSDFYTGSDETLYLYARHTADQQTFFPELNVFFQDLLDDGYRELSRVPFPVVFNLDGVPIQIDRVVPLTLSSKEMKQTKFFRMDLPFGAMSIEFGREVSSNLNELDIIDSGELVRAVSGPLIGCDFSLGTTYLPIFTKFHWAKKFLNANILRALMEQLAGSTTYA